MTCVVCDWTGHLENCVLLTGAAVKLFGVNSELAFRTMSICYQEDVVICEVMRECDNVSRLRCGILGRESENE